MVYVDYKSCSKHNYFGAYSCPKCWRDKERQEMIMDFIKGEILIWILVVLSFLIVFAILIR